jgi:hypothetical protein
MEDEAEQTLASLPRHVRQALTGFMDAVVIVDPMEYQRYPGERPTPLRTLSFGPHDEGLVTFLVGLPMTWCW